MKLEHADKLKKVIQYFNTKESKWGYALLLKGTKHFGYYPKGKEKISMSQAQGLMEDKLAEKLGLPANSLVLDAGSGEGNVAINLAKKYGLRIYGVDLLDFAVNKASSKSKELNLQNKVKFKLGDYTRLDFPDETFDGVYTMETLVHVPDYKKALKEFYRVLKPNGKLVLFEYSMCSKKNLTPKELKIVDILDMVNEESGMHSLPHFLHNKFPEVLKNAGFNHVTVSNITSNIMPMLKTFYLIAYAPYMLIKFLGLQRKFINATSAVEGYRNIKKGDFWRYNIISAVKK
ncbi:MAG: class I SAM-dependent methyltransferase [Candidatus Levybacteria bacterium]|nr:class I SAM-dependent methyltransferase [Candidatus Levybacteria bacterium]